MKSTLLTICLKRFEFSASRLISSDGSITGHNYILWVGVSGVISSSTGMIINIVELKALVSQVLEKYDHRNLSIQLHPTLPTSGKIAEALWEDVVKILPQGVTLQSILLEVQGSTSFFLTANHHSATIDGQCYFYKQPPSLSKNFFAVSFGSKQYIPFPMPSFNLSVTVPKDVLQPKSQELILSNELDFSRASIENLGFADFFSLVKEGVSQTLPDWIKFRVWLTQNTYFETTRDFSTFVISSKYHFCSAHRLHSRLLSLDDNRRIYGKCNRVEPHGHTYFVIPRIQISTPPPSSIAPIVQQIDFAINGILASLDSKYLDTEIIAFTQKPSTGENIATYLWENIQLNMPSHEFSLVSLDLMETPNNLFRMEHA